MSYKKLQIVLKRDHNKNFPSHEPEADYVSTYFTDQTSRFQHPISSNQYPASL